MAQSRDARVCSTRTSALLSNCFSQLGGGGSSALNPVLPAGWSRSGGGGGGDGEGEDGGDGVERPPLVLPPESHPFWKSRDFVAQTQRLFAAQGEELEVCSAELGAALTAKASMSSAIEWLQNSNRKLKERVEKEQARVREAEAAARSGQAVRPGSRAGAVPSAHAPSFRVF